MNNHRRHWKIRDMAGLLGLPDNGNIRVLHMTDFHNSLAGAVVAAKLTRASHCDLFVNTGDISGVGGLVEWGMVNLLEKIKVPHVFVPGNHDSERTCRRMAREEVLVLAEPRMVNVVGLNIWGYRDPNRSQLFGPRYDSEMCTQAALQMDLPTGGNHIIAVHNRLQVEPDRVTGSCVLSGHYHREQVKRRGPTLWMTTPAAGGDPLSFHVRATLVDFALPSHLVAAAWRVRVHGSRLTLESIPEATAS